METQPTEDAASDRDQPIVIGRLVGSTAEFGVPMTFNAKKFRKAMASHREFIHATVLSLIRIRENPTTAKIDDVLIDLQSLTLDQE